MSSSVVVALKEQHVAIVELFVDINAAFWGGDIGGVCHALGRLRAALEAHLEAENQQLYPELIRVARAKCLSDHIDVACAFANDTEYISKTLRFIDRYASSRPFDMRLFIREFEYIIDMLAVRVQNEEEQLYKIYERTMAQPTRELSHVSEA